MTALQPVLSVKLENVPASAVKMDFRVKAPFSKDMGLHRIWKHIIGHTQNQLELGSFKMSERPNLAPTHLWIRVFPMAQRFSTENYFFESLVEKPGHTFIVSKQDLGS